MKHLVLASASPRRAELLRQIGLEFDVVISNAPEDIPSGPLDPGKLVIDLAVAKVTQVARSLTEGIIIGADTVVVSDNRVLGKPVSAKEAVAMLTALSGQKHRVFTGVAIAEASTGKLVTDYEMTEVKFHPLSPAAIQAYVNSGEPFDKAGAYGIQGLGAVLVERIEGCYFNVVGLPLSKLVRMLEGFGVSIWWEHYGESTYN
ncbi:MAG TPA: Maf family protein [Bacillota bacterium]|nr:Maf family protein [Bacillota bacterium]